MRLQQPPLSAHVLFVGKSLVVVNQELRHVGKVFQHVLLHSPSNAGRSKVDSLQGCKPRKLHEVAVVPQDRQRFLLIHIAITEIEPFS